MSKKPADAFRILHTADWHLGKMLNEQSREEEQKRFLNWLLKQVVELEAVWLGSTEEPAKVREA
jgi:hypothetical protein